MDTENKYSPVIIKFSKHENLLDFGFKKQAPKFLKNMKTILKVNI